MNLAGPNLVDLLRTPCALFLDFDGTLVDIAPEPDAVRVAPGLPAILQALQQRLGGALAVVSGRPIHQLDDFLHPLNLPAAGVHGAERRAADGQVVLLPTLPLQHVQDAAEALVRQYPALLVENKRGSVALHYRQAPELEALCLQAMRAAVAQSEGLTLLHGKMVAEAKPLAISKGHAIAAFLQEPPFLGRTPVFFGDDVTDEAGFAVVQAGGGVGVKVGAGPTVAQHRMVNPGAVVAALEQALGASAPAPPPGPVP
jgi:trehalose 6-phosphate phosphatase